MGSLKILGKTVVPHSNLTQLSVLEEYGEVCKYWGTRNVALLVCLESEGLFLAGEPIDAIVSRLTCSGGVAG